MPAATNPMRVDHAVEVLISQTQIATRIRSLAAEIASQYPHAGDGMTIVSVLAGSIIFLGDLVRSLPMRLRIGLVTVSSYAGAATTPMPPKLTWSSLANVAGRDVLIVDDILDTGGTLRLVQAAVRDAGARSVRTTVLLRKPGKAPASVTADFVGFDIDDVFVVGYGLDYDGLYRNLPYIGVLPPREREGGAT